MLVEYTEIISLDVYTPKGKYLGVVSNLIIDMVNENIDQLLLTNTNPMLIDAGLDVSVPFRWVNSIGEVVILKYFPGRIRLKDDKPKKRIKRTKKKWSEDGISRQAWEM